jgi:hypothetical protein
MSLVDPNHVLPRTLSYTWGDVVDRMLVKGGGAAAFVLSGNDDSSGTGKRRQSWPSPERIPAMDFNPFGLK